MMKKIPAVNKHVFWSILLLFVTLQARSVTKTWVPANGGAWTTAANWNPSGVPAAGDDVIINSDQSAAITAVPSISLNSLTVNGTCTLTSTQARTLTLGGNYGTDFTIAEGKTLTMGSSVNITLASNATATINGTLNVNAGTTFNTDGTSVVTTVNGTIVERGAVTCNTATKLLFKAGSVFNMASNTGLIPISTWDLTSTCIISGYTTTTGNPTGYTTSYAQSFGNFTWNCTGQASSSSISLGARLTTVNGDFTVSSTGAGSFSFGISGIGNINIGGNYTQTAGYVYASGYATSAAAATRSINIAGDFSLSGGTFNLSNSNNAATATTLNIGKDFIQGTGTTITETGSSTNSAIRFVASATPHLYTTSGTTSNLVNFIVDSGATLQMGTAASPSTITGGGSFTLQSGATLGVTSPQGISANGTNLGNIQCAGSRSYSEGNLNYAGNSAQVTGNGLTAAANVLITNTAGVTFSVQAAVAGNISVATPVIPVNLGAGFTHTASSLTLGGSPQTPGLTYGGTASNANIKDATYFGTTANGIISLGTCTGFVWIGTTDKDWHKGSNWCSGSVPTASDDVTIIPGSNQPEITSAAICNNITINAGATVTLSGSNTLTVSGTLTNNGGFVTNAGALTVDGNFTNNGSYSGNTGTLVINSTTTAAFTNNGTFTANTGTVNFNGGAQTVNTPTQTLFYNVIAGGTGLKTINAANFVVTGTLSMEGTGTISALPTYGAQAALQYNTATARSTGVEWPATFTAAGGVIVKNSGVITLNAAKTFSNCPLTVFDEAGLANGGFAISGPNAINLKCGAATKGSTISGTGLLTLSGSVNVTDADNGSLGALISCPVSLNAATRDFNVGDDGTDAADLTLSGVVSTAGTLSKIGEGTLLLSNTANTYTGPSIVSGGELRLNPVSTTATFQSQVSLDGGTLSTANIGAGTTWTSTKTLLLNDNSVIALGSVSHSLKFAASNLISWTPAVYLRITGWQGNYSTPSPGTSGKIFVGSSNTGLTAAQLSEIKFYDGTSYYNATQLPTGEVVPAGPISTSFVSVQSGPWNDPATWGYSGSAVEGFTIPGASDNATISADHVVNLVKITTTTGSLTFAATGTLNMSTFSMTAGSLIANNSTGTASISHSTSGTLTVNNSLVTTSGGTLNLGTTQLLLGASALVTNGGTLQTQNTGSAPIPAGKTWDGTVLYDAPGGGQTIVADTYNNLTLGNTGGTQTADGTLVVNGTLSTAAGGVLDMGTNQLLGALTGISNGGTIQTQNTGSSPIPAGKTWGGTVVYDAAGGGQTIASGSYENLTMGNTGGTQTAGGDITVNTALATTAGGTLDMGAYQLAGAFTPTHNGILHTQNTSAAPIPAGKSWGGTVDYNATDGGQTAMAGTYNNLVMSNTSGTQTAGGDVTVNTALTTTAGGTLDMGAYQLLGTLTTITNNGTIQTQNTSNAPIPSGKTWGGTVIYNAADGGQTVMAGTYATLVLSNTGGTQTASGDIEAATLTTAEGGTFNMATYALRGVTTLSNSGIFRTQNSSSDPFPGGLTWGGTVLLDGSAAQTLPTSASIFNNLTISNTSGVTAAAGQTVNGILNLSVANPDATHGSLDMGTYTLTLGPNEVTTGTGDVTGIITRSGFLTNTPYTFGHANQVIIFPVVADQTLPDTITVRITLLDEDLNWLWYNEETKQNETLNSIRRLYEMAQTGGSGTAALFQCNYLDSE